MSVRALLAVPVVLVALPGAGCGRSGEPDGDRAATTVAARPADAPRFVEPPIAVLKEGVSPGSGTTFAYAVSFRLDRSLGLRPSGNARALVEVEGTTAEWVSRVGRRRAFCYAAAPVDAPPRLQRAPVGVPVRVVVRAGGASLRARVRSVRESDLPRRQPDWRSLGCGGRKER